MESNRVLKCSNMGAPIGLSFLATDDSGGVAESMPQKGATDGRSQAASWKVRLVRARLQGRQEGAGVLRRGAGVEGTAVPDGQLHLRDDLRRRHDDRRLR